MAHYTLIARINAGNGRFPFVNVQFTKTHRPIPIAGAAYYLRRSGGARTPIRIGKDLAAAYAALLHMDDRDIPNEVRAVTLRTPSNKPVGSQRKTVVDAAREYLEHSKQKSRKTYIGYRTAVNLFAGSCKKTYFDEIRRDDMLDYVYLLRNGKSAKTGSRFGESTVFNYFLKTMVFLNDRGIARHVTKEDWVQKKDWPVNVEKRNKNKKYSTYLEEEIAALLQAADNTPQYIGTFFVVGVAGKHGNTFTHAVTAKHVAENVDGGPFFFGVNFKDDKAGWLRSDLKWWYHPKESNTDVAVTIMAPSERTDMEYIPEAIFAADETIKRDNIGLGDEISVVGLFTNFVGTSKHFPAVRTGNIADKVPMPDGPMEVYLAEGRSIGGLSGSPVFVRPTTRIVGLGNEQGASSGVWHGRVSLSWADAWPLGFASWCSGRASGSGEHGHFHCSSR